MKKILFLIVSVLSYFYSFSQLTVDEITPETASDIIAGSGVTITSVSYSGGDNQLGSFSGGSDIFGIESGVVIATGNVALAGTGNGGTAESMPADGSGYSTPLGAEHPSFTFYDGVQLVINFTATSTTVQFDIVFASDEYLEEVGADFNDVMGVYMDGPGMDELYAGYENVSLVPGTTDFVSINSVNDETNSTWYINNPPGNVLDPAPYPITYDGFTQKMTIIVPGLICGENYRMNFSIADVADEYKDAALFIGANSIQSNFIVGEIAIVDDSPFCEGDEFTASITYNPTWDYTWSSGESGYGVNSVIRTAVFGTDEISVIIEDGDGCIAERTAEAIVHSSDNVAPWLTNSEFTYFVDPHETLCFGIYSADYFSELVEISYSDLSSGIESENFTALGIIPEVNHESILFCWTPTELHYGENHFTINLSDNNACGELTNTYTFTIIVTCPLCPTCVYYENRTPELDPLPALTEAAKCIEAGLSDPVIVGDDPVEFRAGEYIELGEFFADGPFFAQITGETCIDECTNCCDYWDGFSYDPMLTSFAPDGDGAAEYWFLNDYSNSYCAFNATGYEIWVSNNWTKEDAFYYREQLENYCCPFWAANDETGLNHTVINWDGSRDDGDFCENFTYKVTVVLYACNGETLEITQEVTKLADEWLMPMHDSTYLEQAYGTPNTEEIEDEPLFFIYPSPTSDILNVTIGRIPNGYTKIYVYDINSRICLTSDLESTSNQLDVSMLAPGVYTILLVDDDITKQLKFIKQ